MTFKRAGLRYGETPEPVTPYQKAAQVWDERIGSSRVQAHNWRLMALGSLMLSLILAAILLWIGHSGSATPYIVEVDPRGGARAVGPAAESYKPSDAQIAYHLNAGVDFVIATDHESQDGTTEVLHSYERAGYLRLIREHGERIADALLDAAHARSANHKSDDPGQAERQQRDDQGQKHF